MESTCTKRQVVVGICKDHVFIESLVGIINNESEIIYVDITTTNIVASTAPPPPRTIDTIFWCELSI